MICFMYFQYTASSPTQPHVSLQEMCKLAKEPPTPFCALPDEESLNLLVFEHVAQNNLCKIFSFHLHHTSI
jgi:hypothetical protein